MTALWLLVTTCLMGFIVTHSAKRISEPPFNYDGSSRTHCSSSSDRDNQPANRINTTIRLRQLRSEMVRITAVKGPPLDGYIVTSDDDHQSETVSPRDMRREYITGFDGSAGDALITLNKAVLWTDGRYHIQADNQLDCSWILMKQGRNGVPTIPEWLKYEFRDHPGTIIGADPTLVPAFTWETWEGELANSSVKLVPVQNNLVDLIWQKTRPAYNMYAAYPLEEEYAGRPWQEKVKQVRLKMKDAAADALVITALDEIAWLFNIRGYDLPNTPVLRAFAVITKDHIELYAPHHKLSRAVDIHLKTDSCFHANCVKRRNYTTIWSDLRTNSQAWSTVWLPSPCGYAQGASRAIFSAVRPEKRLARPSPVIALRAEKNKVEAEGMRRAHIRDAVAMCDFLSYMEDQINLDSDGWDEMQVARLANEARFEQDRSKSISFPTIAGYGAHAAQPHYEPVNTTNVLIGKQSTLVVDSGGQYFDGTTDVTRTLHFGEPTEEQKTAYTRVLIGSIQLASLVFPSDLRTDQLDALARAPLWSAGHDYLHGTGHGIGHFLSVHEPPISISYTQGTSTSECEAVKMKPGYFFSNEPGYYKEGEFGVRLENILEVVPSEMPAYKGQTFLKFRDATLVPYEPKLIDLDMLSPEHRRWLNNYNQRIRDEVGPEMKKQLRMTAFFWMKQKTKPIPEWGPANQSSTFKRSHVLVFAILIVQLLPGIRNIWS
ncbi:xaa-Pro aminopeptidase ApepP [Cephus cinctus]|uniref:Xaa-Pro aminopeptidase ApepP n=1 Tax=Cephus cinctus TaxID=211228 RepID=A0AAJ7FH20_CEPCN|nr:xaa-Pro aminopeptidase ApepP [Cephus cinctus]